MSVLGEVDQAVEHILRHTDKLILLQCTSAYPSEFIDINLRVMETFSTRYGVLVGYSGHERGIAVTEAAATLGACVVERHFTKDRTLPESRITPRRSSRLVCEKLVRDIRHIEMAMGSADKRIAPGRSPGACCDWARASSPCGTFAPAKRSRAEMPAWPRVRVTASPPIGSRSWSDGWPRQTCLPDTVLPTSRAGIGSSARDGVGSSA